MSKLMGLSTIVVAGALVGPLGVVGVAPVLAQPSTSPKALDVADLLTDAFHSVAQYVRPSVVSIRSRQTVEVSSNQEQLRQFFGNAPEGSPFEEFFRHFEGAQPNQQPREQLRQGQGTGFIIEPNGYIVTNYHVVENAEDIEVTLHDDRTYEAEIVGVDPPTDVAVLHIDADGLVPLEFAEPHSLEVGQWVIAAGGPFGLTSSITAGIVSATERSRVNVGTTDYADYIQTDAAINPGNSGGPLVDLHGRVVGMNTAIFTRSGGFMGIGFAIPSEIVHSVATSLMKNGTVRRGYLGVYIQDVTQGLAGSFGFEGKGGALVSTVSDDSPAAEAGLEVGDIIAAVNGDPVEDMSDLRLRISMTDPGTRLELKIFRDGEFITKTVQIGELEAQSLAALDTPEEHAKLGMTIHTLTPELADQLGVDTEMSGVIVTNVDRFTPAFDSGLRKGDIILRVDGERVESVDDFRDELEEHDLSKGVRLTVQTGPAKRFVWLKD